MELLKQLLNEMPQQISLLNNAEVDQLVSFCRVNLHLAKNVTMFHSTKIMRIDINSTTGVYFQLDGDKICYVCKFSKVQQHESLIPQGYAGRQVLIKKFNNTQKTGVAKFIFWELVMPEFGCMVSDFQQTESGRGFWEYRIDEALEKGFVVRMLDTNSNTVVVLKTREDFWNLSDQIWDMRSWFTRIILSIAKD